MNALAPIDHKPLSPVYMDEARKPLLILFAAYPEPFTDRSASQYDQAQEMRVSAYLMGLEGLPGWAIEKGVREFIAGKVDRPARSRGKLPTVEELASQARVHVQEEAQRQAQQRRKREEAPSVPDTRPQAERDRMKLKTAMWDKAKFSGPRLDALSRLIKGGRPLEEYIGLAQEWEIPIPEEVWRQVERKAGE